MRYLHLALYYALWRGCGPSRDLVHYVCGAFCKIKIGRIVREGEMVTRTHRRTEYRDDTYIDAPRNILHMPLSQ